MFDLIKIGNFGEVWKAIIWYPYSVEYVAVKFQLPQEHTSTEKEFTLMKRLDHPNVAELYEFIPECHACPTAPLITLEYQTLSEKGKLEM